MIQSEPTEAMIEAGRVAYYTNEFSGHAHAKGLAQAYLKMKALDPDFATRMDSSASDVVATAIGQAIYLVERINDLDWQMGDGGYEFIRQWNDRVDPAFSQLESTLAALTPEGEKLWDGALLTRSARQHRFPKFRPPLTPAGMR